jgi:hypothetical protein
MAETQEDIIDLLHVHYLEHRALEFAMEKCPHKEWRVKLAHLTALRSALMAQRDEFDRLATAKRHARGEIYSKTMVARINGFAPSMEELERNAQTLYGRKSSCIEVLKAHASTHFMHGLASQRSQLRYLTDDVRQDAAAMLTDEERFADAWMATIGDEAFTSEILRGRKTALLGMRSSKIPMLLVVPSPPELASGLDTKLFGKVWDKLDNLARVIECEPLSLFVGFEGQNHEDSYDPARVRISVDALSTALDDIEHQMPSKKAVRQMLTMLSEELKQCVAVNAHVYFEIDL